MSFGPNRSEEVIDGVRVHRVPSGRRHATHARVDEMAVFVRRSRSLLRRLHAEHPFDVVHAHSILPEGLVPIGLDPTVRTVITAHGSDVPGYNPDRYQLVHRMVAPVWTMAFRRADAVTSPSRNLAELIRTAEQGAAVEVIPNGIDLATFSPGTEREGILVVARLVRRKNVALLLEALDGMTPQAVHIVGDGPERARLEALARDLAPHTVHFHGWLEHGSDEWRRLYETSRYFVFMSSQENFPINLLEAQLAGLIVVASDIPGNREAVGPSAHLVAPNRSALHDRLVALAAMADGERESAAQTARNHVIKNFGWTDITRRYITVYRRPDGNTAPR
jgi:glycosyltransferase involved in cell wall biosynthesis